MYKNNGIKCNSNQNNETRQQFEEDVMLPEVCVNKILHDFVLPQNKANAFITVPINIQTCCPILNKRKLLLTTITRW